MNQVFISMEVLERTVILTMHDYVYKRAKQKKTKTQQGKETINAKTCRNFIQNE